MSEAKFRIAEPDEGRLPKEEGWVRGCKLSTNPPPHPNPPPAGEGSPPCRSRVRACNDQDRGVVAHLTAAERMHGFHAGKPFSAARIARFRTSGCVRPGKERRFQYSRLARLSDPY